MAEGLNLGMREVMRLAQMKLEEKIEATALWNGFLQPPRKHSE